MKSREFWVGVLGGVFVSLLVGLFALPALGIFNISAARKPGFLDWWGDTNWHGSLVWRAPEAAIPATADSAKGMGHFLSTCAHCHGLPNGARSEWAHHMQPMPPKLWEKPTQAMSDGELFRVIDQGVRMTGMPAFGAIHAEQDIWNMVAFVRQLDGRAKGQQSSPKPHGQDAPARHQHGSAKGD
jgi:mono/diheme cytochrome c family protein